MANPNRVSGSRSDRGNLCYDSPHGQQRAPEANAGADQTVNEGETVSLNGTFTDVGTDDGHKQEWSVVASNGQVITGQTTDNLTGNSNGAGSSNFGFTPNDNGTYTVSYTVTDDDGAASSDTLLVTVNNVAPTVDPIADQTTTESARLILPPITFSDPAFDWDPDSPTSEDFSVRVDWGDGAEAAWVTIRH